MGTQLLLQVQLHFLFSFPISFFLYFVQSSSRKKKKQRKEKFDTKNKEKQSLNIKKKKQRKEKFDTKNKEKQSANIKLTCRVRLQFYYPSDPEKVDVLCWFYLASSLFQISFLSFLILAPLLIQLNCRVRTFSIQYSTVLLRAFLRYFLLSEKNISFLIRLRYCGNYRNKYWKMKNFLVYPYTWSFPSNLFPRLFCRHFPLRIGRQCTES